MRQVCLPRHNLGTLGLGSVDSHRKGTHQKGGKANGEIGKHFWRNAAAKLVAAWDSPVVWRMSLTSA